ncbi:ROK family protein [Sphingomonas sp. FW199]|uniref:ROK family protein n=1 Tax=Sphingomonas sp. FW199 TaxID=3400217 RepID=UPI003CEC99E5
MTATRVAGIELGGTKCICTLATGPDGVLDQREVPTEAPETTLAALTAILAEWAAQSPYAALGVASFGPIDLNPSSPTYGYITQTPKPGWPMTDLLRPLAAVAQVPVAFDTDVNGAAMAEMRWGAGRGMDDFAYITVGTGVGVGLIVNGRPTRGLGHCELGHLRVPRLAGDTMPSGCPFHDDCVEGMAGGGGLARAMAGRDMASLAPDDPLWDRVAHAVTCLCHALVVTAGPRRIAIGGGVFGRQPQLLPRIEPMLRQSINGYVPIPDDQPYIVVPALGGQAGPLGPIAMGLSALAEG